MATASANFRKITPNPTRTSRDNVIDLRLIGVNRAFQLNRGIRMDVDSYSGCKPVIARDLVANRVRTVLEAAFFR